MNRSTITITVPTAQHAAGIVGRAARCPAVSTFASEGAFSWDHVFIERTGDHSAYRRRGTALALVVVVLLVLSLAPPARAEAPFDPTVPGQAGLALGITEFNPNFVWPAEDRTLPEPFATWRTEFAALRPQVVRLPLDWRLLQREATRRPDLLRFSEGCARGVPPCLGWQGLREQLAALAALQRRTRVEVLVTITGTPEWAAPTAVDGCIRVTDPPRSRPPRDDALPAYRRLVRTVLRAAGREGVELRFWSPWNEPNHPYFLTPQRAVCDRTSPSIAIAPYLKLVEALERVLKRAPGDQQLLLGELAATGNGGTVTTGVTEFIAALPKEVVCASPVWLQHAYLGSARSVELAIAALDAHGCERPHAVWLTETGLGTARAQPATDTPPPQDRPDACARLHAWLLHWYEHPRVTAALQYTFREDPVFRTGLIPAAMDRAYPTLRPWQVWGDRPDAGAFPPPQEQACAPGIED